MLDVDDCLPFLIERGLIDHTWVLDGSLIVRSVARRNRNLRVEVPGGAGFLIKQPGYSKDEGPDTLRCEAAFHRFCREVLATAPLAGILPALVQPRRADDPGVRGDFGPVARSGRSSSRRADSIGSSVPPACSDGPWARSTRYGPRRVGGVLGRPGSLVTCRG